MKIGGLTEDPARYLETSIGSLLEGLDGFERDRIHLSVFLVHRLEPPSTAIPEHFKPWMSKFVDDVDM